MAEPRKLWEHHDPKATQMWRFLKSMGKVAAVDFPVLFLQASLHVVTKSLTVLPEFRGVVSILPQPQFRLLATHFQLFPTRVQRDGT